MEFNKVIPLKKKYTLSCTITKYFSDPHNLLDLLEILSVLVGFAIIGVWFTRRRRVGLMYNFLRDKVMASPDETLNVTHAMADLEAQFGTIDEQTWEKINEVRTNKKEVGYYEDDFLYWKKMWLSIAFHWFNIFGIQMRPKQDQSNLAERLNSALN